jgi:hypothetical protein
MNNSATSDPKEVSTIPCNRIVTRLPIAENHNALAKLFFVAHATLNKKPV